jgi:hypothetical protein
VVRPDVVRGIDVPVTSMTSSWSRTSSVSSFVLPAWRNTSSASAALKPIGSALTWYGPPTRRPLNTNTPSAFVVVDFALPLGMWISVTSASIIGCPSSADLTTPRRVPVTTCADACVASTHVIRPMSVSRRATRIEIWFIARRK